jgi:hypothetical protein
VSFTDPDLLALLVLAVAAIIIDLVFPQRGPRPWDNTRSATQRDVAEVLHGRKVQQEPALLPPVLLLVVVMALAWWLI